MIETGTLRSSEGIERLRQLLTEHVFADSIQTSADPTLDDDTWRFDTDSMGVLYLSPRNHVESGKKIEPKMN